jgi:hypothetical protein
MLPVERAAPIRGPGPRTMPHRKASPPPGMPPGARPAIHGVAARYDGTGRGPAVEMTRSRPSVLAVTLPFTSVR